MPILTAEENAVILQAVLQGGQQARQAAAETFEVFEKGCEDYVTTVDQALDRFFANLFATQFPADGVVTEENQASADRKSTRLNSSHSQQSRMPSSA